MLCSVQVCVGVVVVLYRPLTIWAHGGYTGLIVEVHRMLTLVMCVSACDVSV